jgi:hypothetical protein
MAIDVWAREDFFLPSRSKNRSRAGTMIKSDMGKGNQVINAYCSSGQLPRIFQLGFPLFPDAHSPCQSPDGDTGRYQGQKRLKATPTMIVSKNLRSITQNCAHKSASTAILRRFFDVARTSFPSDLTNPFMGFPSSRSDRAPAMIPGQDMRQHHDPK